LQAVVDSTEALSNTELYNHIVERLTTLEVSESTIRSELADSNASVDIAGNEAKIENGEDLSEASKETILDSASKGIEARNDLNETFNDTDSTYTEDHPDKDKYETLFSYFSSSSS
jgi:hypothetical protein